ncbi:RNA methyltransferase [Candidatus Nanohalobium constans]|uniref:tRNA/rRNA methyltransferase n=1 Tax=Candidatus Nanohalobium constans TaxID=2565781 RepID=A0A5Q0UFG2_9ARCH|nr:RNA methyltransferase [Candidatus Nanohalobium constans]QGA80352.1 tRNA/rRNA methyltransferase [Candidatus Nanohalobium constans]
MEKVILVEPEIPENTGFIARLAANFEAELRIIQPEFNLSEARKTTNKYQDKLRNAEIYETVEKAVENLDYVVGTKPGKGVGLKKFQPRENMSLMIGRESHGLSNKELEHCDTKIHIETGKHSSLNQSHAAAVLMHSFYTKQKKQVKVDKLDAINEETGEVTRKLLKRAAPTEKEMKAVTAEIKSR